MTGFVIGAVVGAVVGVVMYRAWLNRVTRAHRIELMKTVGVVKLIVPSPDEVDRLTITERRNWASVVKDETADQIEAYMKVHK